MATIDLRQIDLLIQWRKSDSSNFTYRIRARGAVSDDSEASGENVVAGLSEYFTITRTQFRGLSGTQIETDAKNKATALLQAAGTGAGGHTINDDTGD